MRYAVTIKILLSKALPQVQNAFLIQSGKWLFVDAIETCLRAEEIPAQLQTVSGLWYPKICSLINYNNILVHVSVLVQGNTKNLPHFACTYSTCMFMG